MIINGIELKEYNKDYYVSKNGDVYSVRNNMFLKHVIDPYGYHMVDIYQKHKRIHQIVFEVWGDEERFPNQLIRHIDDDKNNNNINNLCLGTQRDNIQDCFKNNHRCGHVKSVIVFDKEVSKEIVFPSIKEFIKYTGHSNKSNSLPKFISKKWFIQRYKIIAIKNVETRESFELLMKEYQATIVELENAANSKCTGLYN